MKIKLFYLRFICVFYFLIGNIDFTYSAGTLSSVLNPVGNGEKFIIDFYSGSNVVAPGDITGPTSVTGGQTYTYNSQIPSGFNWDVIGGSIVSTGTNAVQIMWNCTNGTGTVMLRGTDMIPRYSLSVTITSPVPIPSCTVTQPTCSIATGSISIQSPLGGEYTYSVNGSTFQTSPVFNNLNSGTYNVIVKNAGGCTASATVIVLTQPTAPTTPVLSVSQPTCVNSMGGITVSQPVGVDYTYSIGGAFQSSPVFTNLSPGTYSISVKNTAGCMSSISSATISSQPSTPSAPVVSSIIQPGCDSPSGIINVEPLGVGYQYSNGGNFQTSSSFSGLAPASYTITAKSPEGCISASTLVTIKTYPLVQSSDPIVLPQGGATSFVISSGTSIIYMSSQSITLLPGVHIQAGADFEAKIGSGCSLPVAPLNPNENEDINWVTNKVFGPNESILSESKAFFDKDGKLLQTQWKDISKGHVLANQPLYDANQRTVGNTLSAPTNNGAFAYKADFVQNSSGAMYNYKNFDSGSKLNNPDPIGKNNVGSLGWYYSNNNSFERFVPATDYPYSRTDFYNDGSSEGRRSAGVGEQLKMGSGHETQSVSLPVIKELDNYLAVRNKFFSSDSIGILPLSFKDKVNQTVGIDQNGQKGISITDQSGKSLMTGRIGTWYTVNNSVKINSYSYKYILDPYILSNGAGGSLDNIELTGSGKIKVYDGSNLLIFNGLLYDYIPPTSLNGAGPTQKVTIYSNEPFEITYRGYLMSSCENCDAQLTDQTVKAGKFHYFSLLSPGTITVTGDYTLTNLVTDQIVAGKDLPAGTYKIVANADSEVSLAYANSFEDVSYNFYNQLGQLVATIAPEGVKQLLQTNFNNITKKENIPFGTFYNYDAQGRLVRLKVWEGGITEYAYRKDGKIRFSQNSLQVGKKSFSYTNYDQLGRAVESGEYVYGTTGTNFISAKTSTSILESTIGDGGLADFSALKTDWSRTEYDVASKNINIVASGYVQDFTYGGVAYTQNANSETWYSYDDQGQLIWRVQNITGLGAKTIDYTYDFDGNALQVVYQKNTPAESFYHHYEYDLDKRLSAVYTSKDGTNKTLEAKYYYYLHGPLKRVELADNLQGIDYTYTPQGWLKTINHPSGVDSNDPGKDGTANSFAKDVFGMSMEYFSGDYTRSGSNIASVNPGAGYTPFYNGNIQALTWSNKQTTGGTASAKMSAFKYDAKYQLKESVQGTPNYTAGTFAGTNAYKETFTYKDSHGNIGALTRNNSVGTLLDNFSYTYEANSNRLTTVPGYASYEYNALGQLTRQNKSTTNDIKAKYDVTGKLIALYDQNDNLRVSYIYDENGQRIKKIDKTGATEVITWYVSDAAGATMAIYEKQGTSAVNLLEQPIYGADRLGTFFVQGSIRRYELKDHLGNVRGILLRNKNGVNADIYSFKDYYVFGSKAQSGGTDDYRYDYQGQYAEKDKETDWNAFDLRMYDAKIGRWLSFDPKNQYWSPYVGMGNNPIRTADPTGGEGDDDYYFNEKGDYTGWKKRSWLHNMLFGDQGFIVDKDNNVKASFSFNDEADPSRFRLGSSDKNFLSGIDLYYNTQREARLMKEILSKGDLSMKNASFTYKYMFIYAESMPGGQFDFAGTFADRRLTLLDGIAYNNFDAGNYLWGFAMAKMGANVFLVHWASEYNGFYNGKTQNVKLGDPTPTGFKRITWSGDSAEDQRAIFNGYFGRTTIMGPGLNY